MMKAVLPATAKGVEAVCCQLTANAVTEPAVEGGEHCLRLGKRERQQWQCAGRRHLAEGGPSHKEFERTGAQIGEHLWVGSEPALGKHLEAEFATGLLVDCLGHLDGPPGGRAAGRLVQTQSIVL